MKMTRRSPAAVLKLPLWIAAPEPVTFAVGSDTEMAAYADDAAAGVRTRADSPPITVERDNARAKKEKPPMTVERQCSKVPWSHVRFRCTGAFNRGKDDVQAKNG